MKKALSGYEVLKKVVVTKSFKNKDELIFKDAKGKIYFIDKKFKSETSILEVGSTILVWVTKELDKVGYVRLDMDDGTPIQTYIRNIPNLTIDDYQSLKEGYPKDGVFLSNYMYNHDINFEKYLSSKDEVFVNCKIQQEVIDRIDKFGMNSEKDEFLYELITLHTYLYHTYKAM